MQQFDRQAEVDFGSARARAFWREIGAVMTRRGNELLSFEAVRRSLVDTGSSYRGIQTVRVSQIVGTATNRYTDFDSAFLPAQVRTKHRWKRIDVAGLAGESLPPIQLYQVGDLYFVRDGHHRVSVARQKGQEFIDAEVIEVRTRVPASALTKRRLDADDVVAIGEYADFLERTQIDRLRPGADIRFERPGGYTRLIEHILVHQYFMGTDFNRAVSWTEAVGDWYDYIYMPIISVIRERNILQDFPRRTEADLYLWIVDHHYYLAQRGPLGYDAAAADLVDNYSPRMSRKLARALRHVMQQWRAANSRILGADAEVQPGPRITGQSSDTDERND